MLYIPKIPNTIFLTWKSHIVPESLQHCLLSYQKRNPSWIVILASDADCLNWLKLVRPDDLRWYTQLPKGILRADAIRLLWLHQYGGIYSDIDVECLRPLDDLVNDLEISECTIALTRDHPIHERIHFHGIPMWMNDFMIAKPRSPLLSEAIRILAQEVNAGKVFASRNAVMETGPCLLNRAIDSLGGQDSAGVLVIPWEQIHPLPDMSNVGFAERSTVDAAIRSGTWRKNSPFVAHYWYHTWCSGLNMVVEYSDMLGSSPGEALRERLSARRGALGTNYAPLSKIFEKLAIEEKCIRIVEICCSRAILSNAGNDDDQTLTKTLDSRIEASSEEGGQAFTKAVIEILGGYDFQYHAVESCGCPHATAFHNVDPCCEVRSSNAGFIDEMLRICSHKALIWRGDDDMNNRVNRQRIISSEFLVNMSAPASLIIFNEYSNSCDVSLLKARDAKIILDNFLVEEGGFVWFTQRPGINTGNDVKSQDAKDLFLSAGWRIVIDGDQLLMQRPWEVFDHIPRILHVVCDESLKHANNPDILSSDPLSPRSPSRR